MTWERVRAPGWLWVSVLVLNWCETCIRVAASSGHVIGKSNPRNQGLAVFLSAKVVNRAGTSQSESE